MEGWPRPRPRDVVVVTALPFPFVSLKALQRHPPFSFSFSRRFLDPFSSFFFPLPPRHSPVAALVSLSAPSDPTPDNANWSQTSTPRPSCLTPPLPLVISLIVHLTPPSHRLFIPLLRLSTSLIISHPFYWPNVVTIALQ